MIRRRLIVPALLIAALAGCGSASSDEPVVQTASVETPAPEATPLVQAEEPMDSINEDDQYLDDDQVVPDEQVVETNRI